jgi:hypothetical protein
MSLFLFAFVLLAAASTNIANVQLNLPPSVPLSTEAIGTLFLNTQNQAQICENAFFDFYSEHWEIGTVELSTGKQWIPQLDTEEIKFDLFPCKKHPRTAEDICLDESIFFYVLSPPKLTIFPFAPLQDTTLLLHLKPISTSSNTSIFYRAGCVSSSGVKNTTPFLSYSIIVSNSSSPDTNDGLPSPILPPSTPSPIV